MVNLDIWLTRKRRRGRGGKEGGGGRVKNMKMAMMKWRKVRDGKRNGEKKDDK